MYGDFKRKVLKQAQKELKQNTDLHFVFSERKLSRKVIGVEFIIFGNTPKKKNPEQLSFLEEAFDFPKGKEQPAFSETIIKLMNDLGISEQNVAKYLAMEFEIITEEGRRAVAEKRCGTLEKYYLEKLELMKTGNPPENAAGFFIKALKEDWTTPSKNKAVKTKADAEKLIKAKKKLKNLEMKIEKLKKEKKAIETPIYKKLLEDETILNSAYEAAVEKLGEFVKSNMTDVLKLPKLEQYEKNGFINAGIRVELSEKFSEKFEKAKLIENQILKLEKAIDSFK